MESTMNSNGTKLQITPQKQALTDGKALILLPGLATQGSISRALLLQQVYYWTKKTCLRNADGVPVFRYTYGHWQRQFPFLSTRTIVDLLAKLEAGGWICIERGSSFNTYSMNHAQLTGHEGLLGRRLLLADETPIKVFPEVVGAVGMVEAIILQSVHIRTYKKSDYWVKKTMHEWHKEMLPFVGLRTLERAFRNLELRGLLDVETVTNKGRRSKRVRVNYIELALLLSADIDPSPPKGGVQSAKHSDDTAKTAHSPAVCSATPANSSPLT